VEKKFGFIKTEKIVLLNSTVVLACYVFVMGDQLMLTVVVVNFFTTVVRIYSGILLV